MDINNYWINLLIDIELSRNHHFVNNFKGGITIPEIESIIVSGLLIRAISLLDEAIDSYININNIEVKTKNPKLFHRLKALHSSGLLKDYDEIDSWRSRRNDVGHKVEDIYTWEELDQCCMSIFRELKNLSILNNYPQLEFHGKKENVKPSDPSVILEKEVKIMIDSEEGTLYEIGWTERKVKKS